LKYSRLMPAQSQPRFDEARNALDLARMRAELASGFAALAGLERGVSVFGSARTAPDDPDYELARAVTRRLGREGFAIITGGGPGIMEAANRGAREAGAPSVGLTLALPFDQNANAYVDLAVHFRHLFTRKAVFVRHSCACVFFPGGFGTLDELFELVTLIQRGSIGAVPVVLVRRGYWEPLLAWLRGTVHPQGKIGLAELDLLTLADDEDEACEHVIAACGRN
jgi:uncharacterized protein (TIGR00730 family)